MSFKVKNDLRRLMERRMKKYIKKINFLPPAFVFSKIRPLALHNFSPFLPFSFSYVRGKLQFSSFLQTLFLDERETTEKKEEKNRFQTFSFSTKKIFLSGLFLYTWIRNYHKYLGEKREYSEWKYKIPFHSTTLSSRISNFSPVKCFFIHKHNQKKIPIVKLTQLYWLQE